MRRHWRAAIFVLWGAWLAAAPGGAAAGEPTRVRLAMGTPNVQPLAVNLAVGVELGYFREEGIDWSLVPIGQSALLVNAISQRQTEMAVIVTGFLLPLAAKGEAPAVRAFYNYTPGFKYGFLVKADSPIKEISQLRGKKLGIPSFGVGAGSLVRPMLKEHGLEMDKDVTVLAVGLGATVGVALNRGDIDAYLAGDTDLGQIEVQGFPVRQIPFKVPPALEGTGAFYLGAREDYLKANPQIAIGVGRAVAKGTVFALNNLEAATRIFFKIYPEAMPKGKAADVASQDIAKLVGARAKNWVRPNQPPKSWGQNLAKDWEADVKFLGLEGKVPNVERYFTNEFIAKINDFDDAKIAEQARTYKLK